jgi:hypothetical protein
MNPIERAAALRQEADMLLRELRVREIVSKYGTLTATGSYFLDVMVYPDIDFCISELSVEQLFSIGGRLAASPLVYEVVFQRSKDESLPGGLYLKPRIQYGNWERPWKIDFWSLADEVIEQKMAPMWRFKQAMTEALRQQIIRYKVSILTPGGRTPMYSGYFVYKAFIDEGLTDYRQVTQYLIANGIQIDSTS